MASPDTSRAGPATSGRLRAGLLAAGHGLYGAFAWLVFIVLILLFFLAAEPIGRVAWSRGLARRTARLMFRLVGIPLSASGLERLPSGPHLLLVNHTSFLDAIALTALLPAPPGYAFTTRQEFRSQRILCPLLNSIHTVVLRPHGAGHGVNIGLMQRALRRGERLAVFPEGRFVAAPGLLDFHSGAFVVAARSGMPVVVAGLRGARRALPLGTWLLRRTSITLEIGPTLQPPGRADTDAHALLQAARAAMLPLCGEGDALRCDTAAC